MKETLKDANFPKTADGRVYHVGVKAGEVANRILTVGDHVRARRIAAHFDAPPFEHVSQRGFTTLTGRYHGVPISVVAIGMGYPMMDFFVRECRAVVSGDLVIVRLGSCGTLVEDVPVGALVAAKRCVFVGTSFDYFHLTEQERAAAKQAGSRDGEPYWISRPIEGDDALHDSLVHHLQANAPSDVVVRGGALHAAADSFYSSQGRIDGCFADENSQLLNHLKSTHPDVVTLEMETTHLFHLAKLASRTAKPGEGTIRAAGAHLTFAGRVNRDFITPEQVEVLEKAGGKACLEALAAAPISEGLEHPELQSVWAKK